MPVRNAYDEIIAVAQVVNKNPAVDGGVFTPRDEHLFTTYLQFVGIAITNAQIVETSTKEYDRNRVCTCHKFLLFSGFIVTTLVVLSNNT